MPWRAPTDPDKVDEAVSWLRQRVPVTQSEYAALRKGARAQAFTIGGTQQLRVVQTVLDDIADAVANGEDITEFRARLATKLGREFVRKNSARLTTAYRTTAQSAYAAGRWDELDTAQMQRRFPFRIYDAILDRRTTALCRGLDGTIRKADDPYWKTHWPPLHFNCRSSVRALSTKIAMDLGGGTQRAPRGKPAEGFGRSPREQDFEPDQANFSPRAWRAYQKKQKALADKPEPDFEALDQPELHNPYHDTKGRFTTGGAGGGGAGGGTGGAAGGSTGPHTEGRAEYVVATDAKTQEQADRGLAATAAPDAEGAHAVEILGRVPRSVQLAGADEKTLDAVVKWNQDWVNYPALSQVKVEELHKAGTWENTQHAFTQALIKDHAKSLRERGVMDADGYLTLHRGIGRQGLEASDAFEAAGGGPIALGVNTLSSWSENYAAADVFAKQSATGMVVTAKVHHSRVFGAYFGQGQRWNGKTGGYVEHEYVLIAEDKRIGGVTKGSRPKPASLSMSATTPAAALPFVRLGDEDENWCVELRRMRDALDKPKPAPPPPKKP